MNKALLTATLRVEHTTLKQKRLEYSMLYSSSNTKLYPFTNQPKCLVKFMETKQALQGRIQLSEANYKMLFPKYYYSYISDSLEEKHSNLLTPVSHCS